MATSYSSVLRVCALAGCTLGAILMGGVAAGVRAAPGQAGADCGGPYIGVTGQPVVMTATVGLRGVLTFFWTYGDGTSGDKNPTSHVYTAPGSYPVSMRVTSSTLDAETCDTTAVIGGGLVATPTPATPGPIVSSVGTAVVAAYAAGWNLVSGSEGTTFPQAAGALYTLQANDDTYESLAPTAGVKGGLGYWAYFATMTPLRFAGLGTTSASIPAPAGQWVMIGNPSPTATLTVRGADSVLQFDPTTGNYVADTSLPPGRGAWAITQSGGTITVSP